MVYSESPTIVPCKRLNQGCHTLPCLTELMLLMDQMLTTKETVNKARWENNLRPNPRVPSMVES